MTFQVIASTGFTPGFKAMSEESGQKEEVDGPNQIFHDELLERMVGEWKVSGRMGRQPIDHTCDFRWVLNHQFLQLHFLDVSPTNTEDSCEIRSTGVHWPRQHEQEIRGSLDRYLRWTILRDPGIWDAA